MKVRINNKDIVLGEAVAWNLYNADGRVLFRRGFMVNTEVALKKILSLELYRDTEEATVNVAPVESAPIPRHLAAASLNQHNAPSPAELSSSFALDDSSNTFESIKSCAVFLKDFYDSVSVGDRSLVPGFNALVKEIIRLNDNRPDDCLAAIHLYYRFPQSLLQPIYAALLCKVLGDLTYVDPDHMQPLLSAALTANIGMYQYYDKLVDSSEKLSPQQQILINTHPLKSLMLLKGVGICDAVWLETVEQHHERGDGSGYPKGLVRDDIRVEASIYALADSYLGLIMPRSFRPRVEPLVAWQRLSKFNVADDDEILGLFLQYASIYPPGSVVELKNCEIALVLNRHPGGVTPSVVTFGDNQGNLHKDLKIRQTDHAACGIVGTYNGQLPVNADLSKIYMIGRGISSAVKR